MTVTFRFLNLKKRTAKNFASVIALALVFTVALSCDSLFTPSIGVPEDSQNIRATPRGTIEYLFRSYEDKRIDLFNELLPPTGQYRFFISPDYSDIYAASSGTDAILTTIEEGEYHYVRAGNYHYWGHDSELRKHRQLFRFADAIEFTEQPIIDERDFRYRVAPNGDTTHVELRMTGGELCITARDTLYCTQKEGQMQVFLLERHADRRTGNFLWAIKDWFDLNTL